MAPSILQIAARTTRAWSCRIAPLFAAKEGKVQLLVNDFRPNGLAFSPDGSLGNGRVFVDMTSDKTPGGTDGMKVDRQGNVYCTGPGGIIEPQNSGHDAATSLDDPTGAGHEHHFREHRERLVPGVELHRERVWRPHHLREHQGRRSPGDRLRNPLPVSVCPGRGNFAAAQQYQRRHRIGGGELHRHDLLGRRRHHRCCQARQVQRLSVRRA